MSIRISLIRISYGISSCLAFICVLVLIAEGNSNFKGDNVGVVLLSFVMYGLSVIPFTYLCSFAFKSHLTAQNVMILIYLIGGIGLVLISFLLYLSSPSTGKIVRHLFRILPTFCLGDTLFYLNVRRLGFFQASQWDLQISGARTNQHQDEEMKR